MRPCSGEASAKGSRLLPSIWDNYQVRSRILGDWQSFRCLGDQAERLELVRYVNRRRWARSKMSDDAARGRVEGPEANLKQLKCVEKLKCRGAEMRRQNNDGNMGVKAITVGLCQRLSPVAQLEQI